MLGLGANIAMSDRLFSLNDISDLSLYLKNGVGVAVAQWDDSSGNANHATQATAGDQAALAEGGLSFVSSEKDHYDLTSDIVIGESDDADGGFTMFLVCDSTADSGNRAILSSGGDDVSFLEIRNGDSVRLNFAGGTITDIVPNTDDLFDVASGRFLLTLIRENDATGNLILYKDGVLLSQTTAGQEASVNNGSFNVLGTRSDDRYYSGIIHELAFYSKQLSAYELADVHSYLVNKHGL